MLYKTLHRKLYIVRHEPHQKPLVNSAAPGGLAIPTQLVIRRVTVKRHEHHLIWKS